MRKIQYSAAELELAAEEILAELEGWERTAQQRQETADVSRAERFLQIIASVADQVGSVRREEPTKVQQSPKSPVEAQFAEAVNPRNLLLPASTEVISEPSAPLEQDRIDALSEVPLSDRSGKLRSRMQNRKEGVYGIPAEEAVTVWQRMSFAQSQLSAISDWIERDSRRYDSGFSIL